jgi:hypothetical protein
MLVWTVPTSHSLGALHRVRVASRRRGMLSASRWSVSHHPRCIAHPPRLILALLQAPTHPFVPIGCDGCTACTVAWLIVLRMRSSYACRTVRLHCRWHACGPCCAVRSSSVPPGVE